MKKRVVATAALAVAVAVCARLGFQAPPAIEPERETIPGERHAVHLLADAQGMTLARADGKLVGLEFKMQHPRRLERTAVVAIVEKLDGSIVAVSLGDLESVMRLYQDQLHVGATVTIVSALRS